MTDTQVLANPNTLSDRAAGWWSENWGVMGWWSEN
ncbi:hypothetical protein Saa2_09427 [Streptomyces acidiscabies]|nr:hypothetical protein Saa2_09427 [Streptomyces acidiscabies]